MNMCIMVYMKLNIFENMPMKRPARGEKLVQCRLTEDVHAAMLELFEEAKERGFDASWQTFIEAACQSFIKEQA